MKERISYLFLQYYHNKSSKKELYEFFSVVRSAKHDAAISQMIKDVYEELKRADPSLTFIDEQGNIILKEPHAETPQNVVQNIPFNYNSTYKLVAAAVFFLILAGLIFFWKGPNAAESQNIIMLRNFTDQNQQLHLMLSDSTQIGLNSSSSISYPEKFNGKIREVTLKGEAFFDVKHAEKIPFVIHTGKITTVVLGTAFNIKAYDNIENVVVSVKRGKVSVLKNQNLVATLVKGQSARIGGTAKAVYKRAVEVKDIAAWEQGFLVYDDEPVGNIISDLERIYNVDIKLKNNQLKNVLITSSFKRDIGAARALAVICNLTDTHLIINKKQFIIN